MYHNLFDSHTHSDNSHDGHDSISMMCESVSTNNLVGFCVTDHYECNMPENNSDTRLRDSIFEIRKAQAAFKNQIVITCGMTATRPSTGDKNRQAKTHSAVSPHRFFLLKTETL